MMNLATQMNLARSASPPPRMASPPLRLASPIISQQMVQAQAPMPQQRMYGPREIVKLMEEIPFPTTWDVHFTRVKSHGINYQPQLVNAGFLNHQRYG